MISEVASDNSVELLNKCEYIDYVGIHENTACLLHTGSARVQGVQAVGLFREHVLVVTRFKLRSGRGVDNYNGRR